jgi:hypothetical protein
MRTLSLTALLLTAGLSLAAPQLGEKPPKWEYAELSYRTIPARPGGVDADGNQIAAVPASAAVHWISGAGEIDAKSWEELAEKLKAIGIKKDGSPALQKIQFLNYLGSEGWELMEQGGTSVQTVTGPGGLAGGPGGGGGRGMPLRTTTSSTWMLKRHVP